MAFVRRFGRSRGRGRNPSAQGTEPGGAEHTTLERVLGLQNAAGNRATSALLQAGRDGSGQGGDGDLIRGLTESTDGRIAHAAGEVPDDVRAAVRSGGQPLEPGLRADLEALVGDDLGDVRVHTDAAAAASADAVAARGYTVGRDIVLGPGEYAPETGEGRALLAHEVGHAAVEGAPSTNAPVLRQPKASLTTGLLWQVPGPDVMTVGAGTVATIHFERDRFLMDPVNLAAVEKLGEQLSYMAKPFVSVNGHASAEGPGKRNDDLARMRREVVIAILRSKAHGTFEIGGSSYGATMPAVEETATDATELESQRSRNRRAEIVITDLTTPKPTPTDKQVKPPIDIWFHPKPIPDTPQDEAQRNLDRAMKLGQIPPLPQSSFDEQFWKGVDKVVDDLTSKLGVPEKFRSKIRDGAHSAIEKGADAVLDAALDAAKITGQGREAIKKAVEAAAKQKLP
jgi:outer membrane protein OmpA-like peptidoglycan-associated protein